MPKHDLFLILLGALIAGCSTPHSEYQPRLQGAPVGYSDLQLSPTRYRVSFEGSTASTPDDVERYLMRRAAEVTLRASYTHFVMSGRHTEQRTEHVGGYTYYTHPDPYHSDPWTVGPWTETTHYTDTEITTMNSNEAAGNLEAIDAAALLQRLPPPNSHLASVFP